MFFTPKYFKEFIVTNKLGHRTNWDKATYCQLVTLFLRLAYKSILIKCVDLLIKDVDLSETSCTHWVYVLAELLRICYTRPT